MPTIQTRPYRSPTFLLWVLYMAHGTSLWPCSLHFINICRSTNVLNPRYWTFPVILYIFPNTHIHPHWNIKCSLKKMWTRKQYRGFSLYIIKVCLKLGNNSFISNVLNSYILNEPPIFVWKLLVCYQEI